MYTNTTATLYAETPTGYSATYLGRVFLDFVKGKNILQSGLATADSVYMLIPRVDVDIKPNGKNFLLEGGYIQDITGANAKEISDNLKAFKQGKEVFVISTVDKKISGSKRMHHYEVGCK